MDSPDAVDGTAGVSTAAARWAGGIIFTTLEVPDGGLAAASIKTDGIGSVAAGNMAITTGVSVAQAARLPECQVWAACVP